MSAVGGAVLEVRDLVKHFPRPGTGGLGRSPEQVHAVCGVSFDIAEGQTLGLVGESGCGKTTTGRVVLQLDRATAGTVRLLGRELTTLSRRQLRPVRRDVQVVFQDPTASLDPRLPVAASVGEPLAVHGRPAAERRARVAELLELVGLGPEHAARYPQELSGGQRQRVGIARALALEPKLVVLDEPVSSLDVSVRAGVVRLLRDLQDRLGVAYLFIAHDLALVRHLADQVAVMYLGRIVEQGGREDVYARAAHPYTQALLSAVPVPDPRAEQRRRRIVLQGEVPSPVRPPSGCRFRTRCWKAAPVCAEEEPALVDRGQGHPVACHFAELAPGAG